VAYLVKTKGVRILKESVPKISQKKQLVVDICLEISPFRGRMFRRLEEPVDGP